MGDNYVTCIYYIYSKHIASKHIKRISNCKAQQLKSMGISIQVSTTNNY
jgi:hypothetical protein